MQYFSYELPETRIAQRPVYPYDTAKMLVVHRTQGNLEESVFSSFPSYITPKDIVVFNDTKVIPARFFGTFPSGGAVEVVLLRPQGTSSHEQRWVCLGKPLKKFLPGTVIHFASGLSARVEERVGTTEAVLLFYGSSDVGALMAEVGVMPIPPYIRQGKGDAQDRLDYQTLFAKERGSIAAPTASLHFTESLLKAIRNKGARIRTLTLHVGAASFLPLWHEHEESTLRAPGAENFIYDLELVRELREVQQNGGRVIAVGTTVVRALESMATREHMTSNERENTHTELFITPGHVFSLVDAMVTNFHQPRTTHLLLVQAFMGRDLLERSYQHALDHEFRFLSYGDGMMIV